jgi:hypothetical protein
MPSPWRTHAVPLPCHATEGLYCVFPIWFTQCSRVWFTHTMPHPYHDVLRATSQDHSTVWHGMACVNYELALAFRRWNAGDLPASSFFRLPRGLSQRMQHCRKMVGAWNGMCELMRHGSCESAYRDPSSLSDQSEICGEWSGNMAGFSLSNSIFPLSVSFFHCCMLYLYLYDPFTWRRCRLSQGISI